MQFTALQLVKYIPESESIRIQDMVGQLESFLVNCLTVPVADKVNIAELISSLPVVINEPFQDRYSNVRIHLNLIGLNNLSVFILAPDSIGEPSSEVNSTWYDNLKDPMLQLCLENRINLFCFGKRRFGRRITTANISSAP